MADGEPEAYQPLPLYTRWPAVRPPFLVRSSKLRENCTHSLHCRWSDYNDKSDASEFTRVGVSSVSSATSSSAHSTGSSALGKPTRVRQPIGATLRRSQAQSMKMRIQVSSVSCNIRYKAFYIQFENNILFSNGFPLVSKKNICNTCTINLSKLIGVPGSGSTNQRGGGDPGAPIAANQRVPEGLSCWQGLH